jgi:three-Cys-motif partner protein
MANEEWDKLCNSVAQDDGLRTWEDVGAWTQDKLAFWHRYVSITTNAMTDNEAFPGGLIYVDLFAGAGICRTKGSRKRIPGSALIAASTPKPFARIIACEQNPELADACQVRLKKTLVASRCHVLQGDCNELIDDIVSLIPERSLTLAFIDPKGLDAKFTTIETLASRRRVDIVALFADAYDILRNAEYYYRADRNSKLDQVLGQNSGWRERLDALPNQSGTNRRKLFAQIYMDQLRRHLRYTELHPETMKSDKGAMYTLIYASKDKLGLKFWYEALDKDTHGNKRFPLLP